MGFLLEKELQYLEGELKDPESPFVVILGGKKVSDKIGVIEALIDKADVILIGGAMQYAFRKAQGYSIGESYVVDEDIPIAKALLEEAESKGVKLILPADSLEADDFSNDANTNNIDPYENGGSIRDGWEGLDIGQQAIDEFTSIINSANTILWNGPMGVFEMSNFENGTKKIGEAVCLATKNGAFSLVGGGDSIAAIKKFNLLSKTSYVSTGGGAMLEYLEGKKLPGITALN